MCRCSRCTAGARHCRRPAAVHRRTESNDRPGCAPCARRRIAGQHQDTDAAHRPTDLRRARVATLEDRRAPAPAGQRRAVPRADDLAALSASDRFRRAAWWDSGRRDRPARRPHQTTSRPEPRTGSKDVLTPGPADARVRVWTAGADGQRVEAGQAPGAAQHDSWTAFVHPDDVERCREIYRRALERREPFQMEYRVREAGGVERWIWTRGSRGSPGRLPGNRRNGLSRSD